MLESLKQVQTIQVGTEFYRLTEVEGKYPRLAWEETFEDESAFEGGTPNILSDPSDTWHMGGFKSREGMPGTSEYGQNTDTRWPNRLVPGPKLTQIVLTSSVSAPTGFFEAFGELFVWAGTRLYRIDPSDDSVTLSKAFTAGRPITDGVGWDGQAIVALTWGITSQLWKLAALGSPDSWSSAPGAYGCKLAAGLDRLFGIDPYGVLKNVLSGGDPTAGDDWSDEVQCGNSDYTHPPNALVAYERTAVAGKPEGVFGVNDEGEGVPLIRRMPPHDSNCLGMHVVEPYVLVPYERGCFRFMPGFVEAAGLEREVLNESPVRGFFRAFALDGQWIYTVMNATNAFYIVVGREAKPEEGSLGPYIWDTLSYVSTPTSYAIHVSRLWDPPRIFCGYGNNVAYSKLSAGGGAPDPDGTDYRFVTSGVRYTHRYHFGDWKDKDFLKVDAVGRNCDATSYWKISYSVDGGAYSANDIDGVEMRVDENKLHTFILPTTAKGREIQFKWEYVGAADTAMAQLTHFKPYAVPAALKLRHYTLTLYLAGEVRHDFGVEQRTGLEQLNDLYALSESSAGVDCKGPWGDITVHPRRVRVLEVRQEGHELPRFLVEFIAQKREAS